MWKQLEVTADVHNAVFAWVHFRQFAVSQELLLLEVARQAIQQVTAAAGAAPPAGPDGAALPLLVTKGERRSGAARAPALRVRHGREPPESCPP